MNGHIMSITSMIQKETGLAMNDKEIDTLLNAIKSYMTNSEQSIFEYYLREEQNKQTQLITDDLESKAAKLEVTVDYYISEFL